MECPLTCQVLLGHGSRSSVWAYVMCVANLSAGFNSPPPEDYASDLADKRVNGSLAA